MLDQSTLPTLENCPAPLLNIFLMCMKSWHGGARPPKNKAIIDEMQNKLAARRAKVHIHLFCNILILKNNFEIIIFPKIIVVECRLIRGTSDIFYFQSCNILLLKSSELQFLVNFATSTV